MARIQANHPALTEALPIWQQCEDAFRGAHVVKARTLAGARHYLPPLPGHDEYSAAGSVQVDYENLQVAETGAHGTAGKASTSYKDYVVRGKWFDLPKASQKGFMGLAFRSDPRVELGGSERLAEFVADVSGSGLSLLELAKRCLVEALRKGRLGIHVDFAQSGAAERRPVLRLFKAEQILNWSEDGRWWIVEEKVATSDSSEADPLAGSAEAVLQRRLFALDEAGLYYQRRFRLHSEGRWQEVPYEGSDERGRFYPQWPDGSRLQYIPFHVVGAYGGAAELEEPPLWDLVQESFDLFALGAARANLITWIGSPTPHLNLDLDDPRVVNMAKTKWKPGVTLGASGGVVTYGPHGRFSIVETQGSAAAVITEAMEDSFRMAVGQGARLLEREKRAPETAEALRQRQFGGNSVLAMLCGDVSAVLTRSLRDAARWVGADAEPEVELNRDFDSRPVTPEMAKTLVFLWQSRVMPLSLVHQALQAGELVPAGMGLEEYLAQLEEHRGPLSAEDVQNLLALTGGQPVFSAREAGKALGLPGAAEWADVRLVRGGAMLLDDVLRDRL